MRADWRPHLAGPRVNGTLPPAAASCVRAAGTWRAVRNFEVALVFHVGLLKFAQVSLIAAPLVVLQVCVAVGVRYTAVMVVRARSKENARLKTAWVAGRAEG
jgi:hypothetical protein